jgi:nitrite reductase/ring-hydroxylating ferredoxin subunit
VSIAHLLSDFQPVAMRTCPLDSQCIRPTGLPDEFLSRREWIKRFAIGSAVAVSGQAFQSTLIADISAAANPANILKFNLASYPALLSDFGSIRFNLFGTSIANGIIAITRAPGNVFYAMSAYCTHAGCIVDPYDNSPGTEAMICYCHNSVYDIRGKLIAGAQFPQNDLPAYNTALDGNILSVEIPNLNFKVNSITQVTNNATKRFQISFPAKAGARYRILFTPNLTSTPTTVLFSNTSGGSTTQAQINQSTNATRNVWVDSSAERGFYMVEMIITTY